MFCAYGEVVKSLYCVMVIWRNCPMVNRFWIHISVNGEVVNEKKKFARCSELCRWSEFPPLGQLSCETTVVGANFVFPGKNLGDMSRGTVLGVFFPQENY